jgi:hypothetical protein
MPRHERKCFVRRMFNEYRYELLKLPSGQLATVLFDNFQIRPKRQKRESTTDRHIEDGNTAVGAIHCP